MRVLVTCDAIGVATPPEAADLIRAAWLQRAPAVTVDALPLSRGGRGFAAAAARVEGAREEPLAAGGALGTVVLLPDGSAVLEAAQAQADRSSYSVGALLVAAADVPGVRRILVGVGDLRCLDGGLGMLQAMAGRPDDPAETDLGWLRETRVAWRGVPIVAATSHALPMLGFHGAAAHAEEALGLSRQQSQEAENALGEYVDRTRRALPPRRDLLTGKDRRLDREPGAGAGGGVAFGLGLIGAQIRPGAQVSAELAGLDRAVAASDLVVIGEDVFDWRSLQDTVLAHVGEVAAARGRPVVVLSREAHVGRRESASLGVSGVYSAVPAGRLSADVRREGAGSVRGSDGSEASAVPDPSELVAQLAARVAGTWTPA
ncbi:glycerate kinase [Allobranchiibius huperziae]|uniref:Glycerate kinase n=1 Tax=Allobranchiibius huperziae TaxID=1874116 RepID=A0A853DGA1_9MICO|nr:glycerate kinase [Allobranchiibius huperziae]